MIDVCDKENLDKKKKKGSQKVGGVGRSGCRDGSVVENMHCSSRVQFPALASGGSQLPLTPAPGNPTPASVSTYIHVHIPHPVRIHTILNIIK